MQPITADELRSIISYAPLTGDFIWVKRRGRMLAGSVAGGIACDGYARLRINRKHYPAHRLAWLYVYGSFPNGPLDHINCVRSDNRIANLRESTPLGNVANRRRSKNNTTGAKGVHFDRNAGKYCAQIRVNGKKKHLGFFATLEEAAQAYADAAQKTFGEFARVA